MSVTLHYDSLGLSLVLSICCKMTVLAQDSTFELEEEKTKKAGLTMLLPFVKQTNNKKQKFFSESPSRRLLLFHWLVTVSYE